MRYLLMVSALLEFLKLIRLSFSSNCSGLGGTKVCCAGYVWNNAVGNCTPCTLGFHGPYCNVPCAYPSFGKDCQSWCYCSKSNCNHQLGCRKNPQDCGVGFYGNFCEKRCRYPNFGFMCQEHCKCEQDMCHFEKGCKHTVTKSVTTDIVYLIRPSDSSTVLIIVDKSVGNNTVPVISTTSVQVSEEHTSNNIVTPDFNRNHFWLTTGTLSPMAAGIIGLDVVAVVLLFIYAGTFCFEESDRNIGSMEI
ncbi:uncharacterized protein LOC134269888 [Saccostrea cucullata]|uniref:uncharacterized protein LOC134269888 n=1 Tax=Saccostrea cuccullata TaxID=36930 RepID=UPI002ED04E72